MFNTIKNLTKLTKTVLFDQQKFKVSITKGNYEFIIWEKPGNWCSPDEIKSISDDLKLIAQKSQHGKGLPAYGIFSEEEVDFQDRIITIVYHKKSKQPVAFSAQIYFYLDIDSINTKVIHTGLSYIIPAARGQGLMRYLFIYTMVILLLKSKFKPIWISSVSQVPSVIGVVAESFEEVYPDPWRNVEQQLIHKKIGDEIMKNNRKSFGVKYDSKYNSEKQIIENSYDNQASYSLKKTYAETMKHRDTLVNSFCEEELNYRRGDDFLQIGKWSTGALGNFLKKLLPIA